MDRARGGRRPASRWIAQLPAPRQVDVRGYASHEHANPQTDPVRAAYNLRLSRRRLDVAVALVRRAGGDPVVQEALGDTVAAARPGSHGPFGGDPDNRVAQVQVHGAAAATGVVLERSAAQRRGRPNPNPNPNPNPTPNPTPEPRTRTPTPNPNPDPNPNPNPNPNPDAEPQPDSDPEPAAAASPNPNPTVGGVQAAVRAAGGAPRPHPALPADEAVRRTLAPQGFVGLLAEELDEADKVITMVDLDHPFFRKLEVTARMPGEVTDLGLTEAHLSIDYGPAQHVTHGDLVFDPQDRGPKTFTTFLDDKLTMSYDARLDLGFDGSRPAGRPTP